MIRGVILKLRDTGLMRLSGSIAVQVRGKGHLNRPRIKNPHWFLRQKLSNIGGSITSENKVFINQLVRDNYSEPDVFQNFNIDEQNLMNAEASFSPSIVNSQNRRCGTIARKIGEYPLWLNNGEKIRTTLLQIMDNHIISYIPPEKYSPAHFPNVHNFNKFGCLLVGAGNVNPVWLTKEYSGIFQESKVMPKKILARFLVSPEAALQPGTVLNVNHYRVGEFVDVRGKT
ncbi:large ribosomal subunit protein uL3m isoform X2 [Drosophila bipectinata]|nr:putative 39S ribosomal protein L3, mitochondrial isoform X2 [Drosophila bipectinata]